MYSAQADGLGLLYDSPFSVPNIWSAVTWKLFCLANFLSHLLFSYSRLTSGLPVGADQRLKKV
jgi:hypothetical protein